VLGGLAAAILVAGFLALAAGLAEDGTSLVLAQVVSRGAGADADGPTVQAVGYGRASAPADRAVLQIVAMPAENYGPGPIDIGPPTPNATPGDAARAAAAPVVEAIAATGVPHEAIAVVVSPALPGPFSVQDGRRSFRVDVALDGPTADRVNAAVDAAGAAMAQDNLTLVKVGLAYTVADCAAVERRAREAAMADARARAGQQADLMGAELGDASRVEDGPTPADGKGVCGAPVPASDNSVYFAAGSSGSTLPAFAVGAPAEVVVNVEIRATFLLSGPDA